LHILIDAKIHPALSPRRKLISELKELVSSLLIMIPDGDYLAEELIPFSELAPAQFIIILRGCVVLLIAS
jgi:hypothetical protein